VIIISEAQNIVMSQIITIEVSDSTARIIEEIAERTGRDRSAVLSELVDRSVKELPVESLSDAEILTLTNLVMTENEQAELSDLLADQRENRLTDNQRIRLDELMKVYRHGLVRKSEALRVAVERGLMPPLT
jgi:predicted transcriptional regulator